MTGTAFCRIFFLIFTLSGFSGLIYQSIWSHYLKLLLGHAAYAQTIVLAIFMGGMGIGAFLCSRYSRKWKNLLILYAIVEAFLGLFALFFHDFFDASIRYAFHVIIPYLAYPLPINIFKTFLALVLILPQSIMLGMTFPLMTAGMIRLFPDRSGALIAMLYFTNSLGAAVGVLASGFLFINFFGLAGTIVTAGIINTILAVMVMILGRDGMPHDYPPQSRQVEFQAVAADNAGLYSILLTVSLFTGLASFIYEVSWLRMLALVLSASTHAFELMLSAFIFGLAMGGLWIRGRIEKIKNPVSYLAKIQLIMGVLALATLPVYNYTFNAMQWLYHNIDKTADGYIWFNIASHGIALAVMLPTTFCAGITLPLITSTLLQKGHGEKSIGSVYCMNTLGALIGIWTAIHLGLPYLGLKGLLIVGAAIDICAAVGLFYYKSGFKISKSFVNAGLIGSGALLLTLFVVELDLYKMSSSVYRYGTLNTEKDIEILFHKDGKTSTVDLQRRGNALSILTNGKVDATVNMDPQKKISKDEPTMVLSGAIPLSLHPHAKNAAVIGMGAGLTSHTLLTSRTLDRVDTIEIEAAMVEGARGFLPRVERTFNDPRSHVYIEDARSYFASHQKKYDIIISEPSNPWVSGVASLFTHEYYASMPNFLNEQGIFAQWIQLYESNMDLLASIIKALTPHFDDYAFYMATRNDLIVIAKKKGKLNVHSNELFESPELRHELQKISVHNIGDIKVRRIGAKSGFAPFFQSFAIRANSDYHPIVDLQSAQTRFLDTKIKLSALSCTSLPVAKLLDASNRDQPHTPPILSARNHATDLEEIMYARIALVMRDCYHGAGVEDAPMTKKHKLTLDRINSYYKRCQKTDQEKWIAALLDFSKIVLPHLTIRELDAIWQDLQKNSCYENLLPEQKDWIALLHAISLRDGYRTEGLASWLLTHGVAGSKKQFEYLVAAAMLGEIMQNRPDKARDIFNRYSDRTDLKSRMEFRLLLSHLDP